MHFVMKSRMVLFNCGEVLAMEERRALNGDNSGRSGRRNRSRPRG